MPFARGAYRTLALATVLLLACRPVPAGDRSVAVTFDDLPGPPGGLVSNDVAALRENTRKLLGTLTELGVPAVGFVNEGKLFVDGEGPTQAEGRKAVLRMWIDAGFELGNHTYSHKSLNTTPLAEFEDDVVRGEPLLRGLLAEKGRKLRYFRHPFLQVGLDLEKRRAFESFLAERGYTVAPVTIDNDDYVFAAVYADALRRGDRATAISVRDGYLRYMDTVLAFVEDVSLRLLGHEVRQVLLLHANTLNADLFGRLADSMKVRGYGFITLDDALKDDAYRFPDRYAGRWGISWLRHWELTAWNKGSPSPDPPDWVLKAYKALAR